MKQNLRLAKLYSRKTLSILAVFLFAGLSTLLINCNSPSINSDSTIDEAENKLAVLANTPPTQYNPNYQYFGSTSYEVPQDIQDSSQVALAQFAWMEFIALNWPSSYDTTSYTRGKPNTSKTLTDFLVPDMNHPLVWQTYKHRVEVYPKDITNYDTSFNSKPTYLYDRDGQTSISRLGNPSAPLLKDVHTVFNNLDESTEINLCTIFFEKDPNAPNADKYTNPGLASGLPGAPRRLLFEAKANQDMFDYVVANHLYDSSIRKTGIAKTLIEIANDSAGAVYPCPDPNQICFPFGGDQGKQGNILVKATWKQLTLAEYNSGRYLTSPIIYYRQGTLTDTSDQNFYYDIIPAEPTDSTLPYGLAGLHIIHKTVHYPSYVFATFEQVDNLTNDPSNALFYYNRYEIDSTIGSRLPGIRYKDPLPGTVAINNTVHSQIKTLDSTLDISSVWKYYQLIGVQGPAGNYNDTSDFYLANVVTETNQPLRDFTGTLNTVTGVNDPQKINLFKGGEYFIQGGCKGCHGNAQQSDFSFITQNAPFDGTPDAINQPILKNPKKK